jgi:dihydroorotase
MRFFLDNCLTPVLLTLWAVIRMVWFSNSTLAPVASSISLVISTSPILGTLYSTTGSSVSSAAIIPSGTIICMTAARETPDSAAETRSRRATISETGWLEMNEGPISEELGLPGLTAAAEEIIIARDIELARLTGGWLHVLHVSTERGRDMVRRAVREGLRVTAEVMPHHLLMTDEWVAGRRRLVGDDEVHPGPSPDPNAKVNPPLRTEPDARALLAGLIDGTFEILATDHAPHAPGNKTEDMQAAASGMIGLEVAVPLLLELVRRGDLPLPVLVERLSTGPARIFNLAGGTLKPGSPADVTVIDPDLEWTVDETSIASKSKNTPLLGMRVTGRSVTTILGGEIVHDV